MRKTAAGPRSSVCPKPESEYGFIGFHLLANFTGCREEAIRDLPGLRDAMARAARASGATVLESADHVFDTHGLSHVLLLSESHASIHTYPEVCSCFLDLFTCGTTCRPEAFEAVMRDYLQPASVSSQVLVRHQGIEPKPTGQTYVPAAPAAADAMA